MDALDLFADARRRLEGVPQVRLGAWRQPRRILGIRRAATIVPAGAAWHLGALLLTDDAVLTEGEVLRARAWVRRGFTAQSQRERAERADAARRGGFAESEVLHVDWEVLDASALASDALPPPLALIEGIPSIRWAPGAAFTALAGYLSDRIGLLRDPPRGAT